MVNFHELDGWDGAEWTPRREHEEYNDEFDAETKPDAQPEDEITTNEDLNY
jgi:hypothetical protein